MHRNMIEEARRRAEEEARRAEDEKRRTDEKAATMMQRMQRGSMGRARAKQVLICPKFLNADLERLAYSLATCCSIVMLRRNQTLNLNLRDN